MIAALFFRHVPRCLSRQLYETLILPPINHFENGYFHSSTFFHFLNQCSSPAAFSQNFRGFFVADRDNFLCSANEERWACLAKDLSGGKTRFSRRTEVIPEGVRCSLARFMPYNVIILK